jgi:signal transduction histidine kinase
VTGITSRFVLLIATAAVAPLVVYGLVSMQTLRQGTRESVRIGNERVAQQVATQIKLYIDNNARILRSIAQELGATDLAAWQKRRVLANHVLEFPEFREITLFDAAGRVAATSRIGAPATQVGAPPRHATHGVEVAAIRDDEDGLPVTDLTLRLGAEEETAGWLVARISLEELWRFVDRVRVGQHGYALVLSADDRLVAHGNPDAKRLVAMGPDPERPLPYASALGARPPADATFVETFTDGGVTKLGAFVRVPDLNWTVVVEQPTSEAYAFSGQLTRQLLAAIALALLVTMIVGWVWARWFITRTLALTRATQALAEGRMGERVAIRGRDEIGQLGLAFNAMADRLTALQEDVRKQERQAMFGRIAAGLVHDLSHPIQNIGNSCKLIVKMFDDTDYRETFRRTVDREMTVIKRVLDDLRNIARPIPLERFPVDVNRTVADAAETMASNAEAADVTLRTELSPEPLFIEGDVFALGRVYRNLILNAIQATAPGGLVAVSTAGDGERVQIRVADTGCGIPADRLGAIFDDFVTTKSGGLGLGLAISRKIVQQLDGEITVASEAGRGTTFVIDFPRSRPRPVLVAGGRA